MKIKLKKLFLIGFALSTITSCSVTEMEEHEHGIEASIKSRKITFNEFKSHTKAFNLINDVNKKNVVSSFRSNRIIRDTIRNFSIDTQEGLYITYANLHSYTFPVYRDFDNGKLENLVLSSQSDGSYKVKLLIYNLTAQEKIDMAIGRLKGIQNPIVTIPIQNFDTNFTEARSCEEVSENIFISCSSGEHSYGSNNAFDCRYWNQSGGTPPRIVTRTRIKCITSDSDGNVGGSNADGGFGDNLSGGSNNNDYPPEYPTVNTPPEEYNLGISIPVQPNQPEKTPCDDIKFTTNSIPNLKANIASFKTPAVLNLNFEKGFNFVDSPTNRPLLVQNDGNPNSTSITVAVPENGTMSGLLHSHFDRPDMLPTFTFEDLMTFNSIFQWRKFNAKPLDNLTVMVVSRAGVFALKIENEAMFDTNGYNLWTDQNENLRDKFYKDLEGAVNLTDNDVIISTIKSLSKYGVALYQAHSDVSNWSKLTVDANNNIIPTPCN